jgi:hypothetical protein
MALVNNFALYSCQRRQLRTSRLIAVALRPTGAYATGPGVALIGSRFRVLLAESLRVTVAGRAFSLLFG